ncbi:hypothetical protein NVP1032O_73 [Vibrio phage 1.032.O._10N.261.54.F5]|nr:hypothetical protein NVP1032O_73 [Vibrio phage 1.032.O._10N.261.54.F5]
MSYEYIAREAISWIGDIAKCHEDSDFFTEMTNKLNGANTAMSISKQEFILNNITEMVRLGNVGGPLLDLAVELAKVWDYASASPVEFNVPEPVVNNGVPYVQSVMDGVASVVTQSMVPNTPVTDVPSIPHEATEPTPIVDEIPTTPVADVPTEPTPPAERTHDDWGLPFSDEWHVSTRNTAKPGYFKRKPGTNEEQYAAFIQQCVTEAGDAFTGPDNWATVSRLSKYLDPVQATPDAPQVVDAPTLQPQAETVGQAMHTGATVDAPTEPTPAVEAAPVASVGASASSDIPPLTDIMPVYVEVAKGFGFYDDNGTTRQDPRVGAALERLTYTTPGGVEETCRNMMDVKDTDRRWLLNALTSVAEQLEVIKADPSGEILKTVLDSVTA